MANRSEILSFRTALPVGVGVAIGIVMGAVALAHAPAAKTEAAPAPVAQETAIQPLSSARGVSFVRMTNDGERCFAARQARGSAIFCAH